MPKSSAVETELPDDVNDIFDKYENEGGEESSENPGSEGPDDEEVIEDQEEPSIDSEKQEEPAGSEESQQEEQEQEEIVALPSPEGLDANIWQKIPAEAQQALVAREAALQEAAKFQQDYGFIGDYVARHAQTMAIHGATPEQSLRQLMALNELAQQDPAQYLSTFQQITGFNIAEWVMGQQAEQDYLTPEQAQLNQIQQQMQKMQRDQLQAASDREIAAFRADPNNKFFDRPNVQAKMTEFISRGVTANLAEAYQMAIFSLPEIREEMSKEAVGFTSRSTASAVEKAKRMTTVKLPEQSVSTPKPALSYKAETSGIFDKHGLQ